MHGAGNDFVVIDSRDSANRVTAGPITPELARAIGDRHRGVGFDQMAEIIEDDEADYRLVFWNADGSQAGACGNASRCVAALMMAGGLVPPRRWLRCEDGLTFPGEGPVLSGATSGDPPPSAPEAA